MRTIHARLALLLSALLLAAPFAAAQGPGRQVIDDVGFWSDAAKAKANQQIAEIKRLFNKDLVIEAAAAPKLPAGVDAADKNAVNSFYDRWAQHRYEELDVKGVYVVVVPSAHKIRFDVGRAAQAGHFFTVEDGRALVTQISALLAKNPDDALGETVRFVETRMKANHAAVPPGFGQQPRGNGFEHGGGFGGGHASSGSGWGALWAIVGLAIVAWIVIAVIRSIGGMGRGAGYPGYGGGYGGGGFFSNMLGGLFGAAAGMYLYNSFFGHGNSAWGAGSGGDYGSSSDPNAGDSTATGGGGDYGDAGDATGGGGDWGGGDAGGGGGGDWGGGGGGDWGGGGGGDFGGGGGGDW
jgi:hypothetical protein